MRCGRREGRLRKRLIIDYNIYLFLSRWGRGGILKYFCEKTRAVVFGFYDMNRTVLQWWKNVGKIKNLFGSTPVIFDFFALNCGKLKQNGS